MEFLRVGSIANIMLGACLMLSALLARSAPMVAVNAALVGVLTMAVGIGSLRTKSWLHIAGIALGVWELGALFYIPGRSTGQAALELLLGVMIFSFSCVGMLADDPEVFEGTRRDVRPTAA